MAALHSLTWWEDGRGGISIENAEIRRESQSAKNTQFIVFLASNILMPGRMFSTVVRLAYLKRGSL